MSVVPRILIAGGPACTHRIEHMLGTTVQLLEASTVEEVLAVLKNGVELIICSMIFEESESHMLDLLRLAKADPATRAIPFLCVRIFASELTPLLSDSLQIACTALGAVEFFDLVALQSQIGIQEAEARFRQTVRVHIARS